MIRCRHWIVFSVVLAGMSLASASNAQPLGKPKPLSLPGPLMKELADPYRQSPIVALDQLATRAQGNRHRAQPAQTCPTCTSAEAVVPHVLSTDAEVRRAALGALTALGDCGVWGLVEAAETNLAILDSLPPGHVAESGTPWLASRLWNRARARPDPDLRKSCFRALEAMGKTSVEGLAQSEWTVPGFPDDEVEARRIEAFIEEATRLLGDIGGPEVHAALLENLHSPGLRGRAACAAVLRSQGVMPTLPEDRIALAWLIARPYAAAWVCGKSIRPLFDAVLKQSSLTPEQAEAMLIEPRGDEAIRVIMLAQETLDAPGSAAAMVALSLGDTPARAAGIVQIGLLHDQQFRKAADQRELMPDTIEMCVQSLAAGGVDAESLVKLVERPLGKNAFEQRGVRTVAASAMAVIGHAELLPHAAQALTDPKVSRAGWYRILGRMKSPAADELMLRDWRPLDIPLRVGCLSELIDALSFVPDDIINLYLQSPARSTQLECLQAIDQGRAAAPSDDVLLALIGNGSTEVRRLCVRVLGRRKSEGSIDTLAALLPTEAFHGGAPRDVAALSDDVFDALRLIGSAKAMPALLETSVRGVHRLQAIRELIRAPGSEEVLTACLRRPQSASAAAEVLTRIAWTPPNAELATWYYIATGQPERAAVCEEAAIDPILLAVKQWPETAGRSLVKTLHRIGSRRAAEAIAAHVMDSPCYGADESVALLKEMLGKESIPALRAMLACGGGYMAAATALQELQWSPPTLRDSLLLCIALHDVNGVRRRWDELGPLLLDDLDSGGTRMLRAAKLTIAVGRDDTIDALRNALHGSSNKDLAELFLNCGESRLYTAASEWAKKHNLRITSSRTGSQIRWGGK